MRRLLSWDTLAWALLALFAGFVVFYPITDTDIWWHLASAREMLRTQGFLRTDPFSFTPHDEHWITLHWIFQLVVHALYTWGGAPLVVWVKCICFSAACLLVVAAFAGKRKAIPALAVFAAIMFEVRYLVLARPVIITLMLMAVFLWTLEKFRTTGNRRFLLLLVPAQIVWVNSQGLFMLGPAIVFAYWVGECLFPVAKTVLFSGKRNLANEGRFRSFVFDSALCALVPVASLVNPYGVGGLSLSAKLFGRINPSLKNIYALNVSENIPLRYLWLTEPRYVYAVVGVTLVLAISFWMNRRSVRVSHIILSAMFLALAWMAQRNILLYFFVAAPMIVWNLLPTIQLYTKMRWVIGVIGVVIVARHALTHAQIVSISPPTAISPFRHPQEATEYLKRYPIPGQVFNCIRAGGYLLWNLYPPKQVFIDGRLVLRTPEFFAEYLTILDHPEYFDPVAAKFGITHVVLPTAIFDRYMPLVRKIYHDPRWEVASADGGWVLYVRDSVVSGPTLDLSSPEEVNSVLASIQRQWQQNPAVRDENYLYLGNFLLYIGEHKTSRLAYAAMERGSELHIARSFIAQNEFDSARVCLDSVLASQPKNRAARMLRIRILLRQNDLRSALENVILVLRRDPLNREARSMLRYIRQQLN